MARWTVREDPIELTGTVVSVDPRPSPAPALWTFLVIPDSRFEFVLSTRSGAVNPDGTIPCSVGLDPQLLGFDQLIALSSGALGQSVRVVGTWCDDDATGTTAIRPLGVLAISHPIEVYDIDGWPVAVRDHDVWAFAHTAILPHTLEDEHVGESRSLTIRLPFPKQPSAFAKPFHRTYGPTIVDRSDGVTLGLGTTEGLRALEVTIETGDPNAGAGFWTAQVGLTFEEPELDDFCPPGCDDDGVHCAHEGDSRFMWVSPFVGDACKGDLALSPGDGRGLVSGIVAAMSPPQVYDHMGIFVDAGRTIRHCTSSQDRFKDDALYAAELRVAIPGIVDLGGRRIPLNGFRPDLVWYGWPGTITQTVEEVYRTGRNSLNPRWTWAAVHPGEDVEDPEVSGEPFRLYQLPRLARRQRLEFSDPERVSKSEAIVRMQSTSVGEHPALLVRPHQRFNTLARPALELVADMALRIDGHYRFFAYSRGEIGLARDFDAPPPGDPRWAGLPPGADWAAGTVAVMCASLVWTAVQLANDELRAAGRLPIVLEDRREPEDPDRGLEYGMHDGLYRYDQDERLRAAATLARKLADEVRKRFDDEIPDIAYVAFPPLTAYRELTAANVSNQIANAFALDGAELLGDTWKIPTEGETVGPDNVTRFWDLQPASGHLVQPDGGIAVYGDAGPLLLTEPGWQEVKLFRKQDVDVGTGAVTGRARIGGVEQPGVTVRIDFGCEVALTTDGSVEEQFVVALGVGTHFAEGFIVLLNPVTGTPEMFQTREPLQFEVSRGRTTFIELDLEPPSDLWRSVELQLDADIRDSSLLDEDAHIGLFHVPRRFEIGQDLRDDPDAPPDQQNSKLRHEDVWRTEPEVGSGVHVAVAYSASFEPTDRSVHCHVQVALIDTDSGGFLGIGTSSDVDQLEVRDVVIPEGGTVEVLKDAFFESGETIRERATVTLTLTNTRRRS